MRAYHRKAKVKRVLPLLKAMFEILDEDQSGTLEKNEILNAPAQVADRLKEVRNDK